MISRTVKRLRELHVPVYHDYVEFSASRRRKYLLYSNLLVECDKVHNAGDSCSKNRWKISHNKHHVYVMLSGILFCSLKERLSSGPFGPTSRYEDEI